MSSVKKKRKLTSGEGFTLGADENLGLSIGALFRGDVNNEGLLPPVPEEKTVKVKSIDSEKEKSCFTFRFGKNEKCTRNNF